MTHAQKELLREVLIDYMQLLTTNSALYNIVTHDKRIAQVRLLLKEVA